MAFKAAIRAGALKTIGSGRDGIQSAESHAKRLDPVAQGRVVIERDPIAWSKAKSGALDYVEAFKAHKQETGAGERKGSALALEFKAVVSPDWLAEGGADPRDPNNPRVQQLVAEAKAWAESWGGKGAVWAVRYDTDEKGAGVVDLFMSPVRQQAHKSGKSKAVISTGKAKAELLEAEKALDPSLKTSGAAMQSSWARWSQQRLDARIERGQSREQTGREHVHAEIYAAGAEKARAEARRDAEAEAQALKAQILAEASTEAQRAAQALKAQILAEARAEATREAQAAKAQIHREALTEAARAAHAEISTLMDGARAEMQDVLRAEVEALEEKKRTLTSFLRDLSAESVRLNMALQWAENYASSFKAGLGEIFGIREGAGVWDRLMEFWRTDADHNPQAAAKPEQDTGLGLGEFFDDPEPEPPAPPPRRYDGPGF